MNITLSRAKSQYLDEARARLADVSAHRIDRPLPLPGSSDHGDRKGVRNIYASDVNGNPVEVLLFDKDGEPLLILPESSYGEALSKDGQVYDGDGAIRFATDEMGRIVPNLYPVQILGYDSGGGLVPALPPSIGFPDIPRSSPSEEGEFPATTGGAAPIR